jgi:Ser-tRNA(Ala) deacylase AlaX
MEELGNWFYIIILIIAALSSLLSSKRKKVQQMAEQHKPGEIINTQSKEDDFWDDHSTKRVVEELPVVPVKRKQTIQTSFSTSERQKKPPFNMYQEGTLSHTWDDQELMETIEEYGLVSIDELHDNTDEWRKAFVYNEIYNRKYE